MSIIELAEPVTEVAAGSSSYKIEWRGNNVFVQPLDPEATTNLFIWTATERLSHELVPAIRSGAASTNALYATTDSTVLLPMMVPVRGRWDGPATRLISFPPVLKRSLSCRRTNRKSTAPAKERKITSVFIQVAVHHSITTGTCSATGKVVSSCGNSIEIPACAGSGKDRDAGWHAWSAFHEECTT